MENRGLASRNKTDLDSCRDLVDDDDSISDKWGNSMKEETISINLKFKKIVCYLPHSCPKINFRWIQDINEIQKSPKESIGNFL